jgi:hypothetical protein
MSAGNAIMDLSGHTYGQLTVIKYHGHSDTLGRMWLCRCACGNLVLRARKALRAKTLSSCGCARGYAVFKHGKSESKPYRAWLNMRRRCFCERDAKYADYGGRGITVCSRWSSSFDAFYGDMGDAPTP